MSPYIPENSQSKYLPPAVLPSEKIGHKNDMTGLTLAAIGVVFGDIGTSPLYALKACFSPITGIALTSESLLGVISLIFWAFVFVVSLKYVLFVMRANNNGEGGILALMALTTGNTKNALKRNLMLVMIGVFGACLFYGDAVITPAISVLSALEGLQVISNGLESYVVPATIAILLMLFYLERKGTTTIGHLFGPIMLIWFSTIGLMGLYQIISSPEILFALNPVYAIKFATNDPAITLTVTGSIFLVLTGAEALYADMGHFGSQPIQFAWFVIVMPCLLLNYFGQGALLINHPEAIENTFFLMIPGSFSIFIVILSTIATVIASQACISGAYSMTSQAMLLGFLPRMRVIFTSEIEMGQIYIPLINWILCFIVIMEVLAFQKSENLASAYGVAVSTTMLMTTLLTAVVMRTVWRWNLLSISTVISVFTFIDACFFISNLTKISQGGWFPLLIGGICFFLMTSWHQGREWLHNKISSGGIDIFSYMKGILNKINPPMRVEGTAIFLSAHIDLVPNALPLNIMHNKILHERNIFLKICLCNAPYLEDIKRLTVKDMSNSLILVRSIYGFKETPDVGHILDLLNKHHNINCLTEDATFFLPRDSLNEAEISELKTIRERLFGIMIQNASRAEDFYKFDPRKVIKLGSMIDI